MIATTVQPTTHRSEWFTSWFDSFHYHKLYAHRDETEAARFLDGLIAHLKPRQSARLLDLGCGAGRHAKFLASKGFRVTGLDLAAGSISEARKSEQSHLRFLRHDMRVPFGRNAFDYVFSFFTSFGYFEEPGEHMGVVRNMARSLRQGGMVVLDYLNVRYAEATLTCDEVREIDGVIYRLTRRTDTRHFFKRIVIEDGNGEPPEFVERVAKFTLQDFERMFARHHLSIEDVHGDYRLSPYDFVTSPRMILVARKKDTRGEGNLHERLLRTRLTVSGVTSRYDANIHRGTRSAIDGYVSTTRSSNASRRPARNGAQLKADGRTRATSTGHSTRASAKAASAPSVR